ncbi:bifunctional nuclease family protein [Tessaracoccus lubricantis]|uniref:Bifunctional nuclease family protein n=1 Tax=Tessaracoccus lubricantis TaxID=545543 RepID=A0ABP9FHK3_9ACTN
MIQVDLNSIAIDARGLPVVLLKPSVPRPDLRVFLPIWIGGQEATAIMVALEGAVLERPMSYDLMARLLDAMDARVEKVAVTKLEGGTFFAEITLDTLTGQQVIDARPSDSIALALRVHAPIFVAEEVLREAGIQEGELTDAEEEEQVEQFSEFLDTVDPDDFRG